MQVTYLNQIRQIVQQARQQLYRQANSILLHMYWNIGRLIVEEEQQGDRRAGYGKRLLKILAEQLTLEFGKGFDESNLRNMRQFYLSFQKYDALRHELSWTHYRILARVENEALRKAYMTECAQQQWNTRALQRNIDSAYLGRVLAPATPQSNIPAISEFIKDPYIFEFLGLQQENLHENELETALVTHLQKFLMELGKGFAFVARQQHVITDTSDFFIDLVFYNYLLKCFVLIDLKTGKLTPEDIGKMDMYVRMYNDLKVTPGDNPTIGIILCTTKDETIVKFSVLAENEHLFASTYRLYMPDEHELKQLIEHDRILYELKQNDGNG